MMEGGEYYQSGYIAGLEKAKEIAVHLSSLGDKIVAVGWLITEIDKVLEKVRMG